MNPSAFRVAWKSTTDNAYYGHGEFCLTQEQALDFIGALNEKYSGEIIHWVEEEINMMEIDS